MNNIENPNNYQESENIEEVKKEIPNFEAVTDGIKIKKFLEEGDERIKATMEQCEHENKKLETFADAIGNCEYYIGGGLAVEIEEKKIEHVHGDMDIIVFEDELEKIREHLESKGFDFEKNKNKGGHDYDAKLKINENADKVIDYSLHIGIFVYKRNEEKNTVEQLNEDGSINKEFPLDYFDAEKQTIKYNQNKLCVADLRLVLGLKMISERPKDVKDIRRIRELLISKYQDKKTLKEEMEKLKTISQENIKTTTISKIKDIFSKLTEDRQEITSESIYKYFKKETRDAVDRIQSEKYKTAVYEFLERIKNFSINTKNDEQMKKDFEKFALNNAEPLLNYYDEEIERIINEILI